MRFSNPAAISRIVMERLTIDPAGAPVRVQLGAGAASVIHADELSRGLQALPARPLIAYRAGAVATVQGVDVHTADLWIYDDPEQRTYRIDQIAAALPGVYDYQRGAPTLPSPAGAAALGTLGEPRTDPALGLAVRRLPLTIDA